jgi:segregation and condensation protein A
MPLQEDYQVSLEAFHGPLDLLLFLIRRAEVDVQDISIAQITDQYLVFLKQIDDIDIDLAGEFLVMAATLIEIKSRAIAPIEKPAEGDGEAAGDAAREMEAADPRFELIQQLLAYQRYRIAADELEKRRVAFLNRFPIRARRTEPEKTMAELAAEAESETAPAVELELDDAHVLDLSDAYARIMESIDFTKLGEHRIEVDDTPIALHQEDLLDRLTRAKERRITLQEAFEGKSRGQRIGLFLAMLELTRVRRITVRQDEILSPIVVLLNDDPDIAISDSGIAAGDE